MVPSDRLLRNIDAVRELSWLRSELAPYDGHTGCPSVDPELLIRMLIVGDCHSIRSERRLCQEVKVNLAYRWFCRLGLEDRVPDHSTFSVNRHGRFRASDILRKVFEEVGCRLFGEAKSILSMVRLRLRGLTGARDEFLLTATVQNLKRLANHTTGPPPQPMMA